MHRFFISSDQAVGETLYVEGSDVNHIRNVLRMRPGEDFEAVDENGLVYTCRIDTLDKNQVTAKVLFTEPSDAELPNRIVLFMGLPKFEKMELIIQKAVELGVAAVVPVKTARCVVKLDEKRAASKQQRWQGIAESAAKQSKRSLIPPVENVMSYKEALALAATMDHVLIPYEKAEGIEESRAAIASVKNGESVAVFIGPEGGFELSEVEEALAIGAKSITLGPRILRCETAAITTLSILMYALTT
ncbi:MAG: 16S rRNA (uracil(1498)-N(3))-methyltransferase [Lachnospiraceae bacterium]|nr:16S rRNA (uracil(1498)-N(3))-methyltransferase [Lachnospiraceae bacterium]